MLLQITGVGRVGNEPEMRYTPAGHAVTNFSVACKVGYGEYEQNIWVRISCFGSQAEAMKKYLGKGDIIAFVGIPNFEDGSPRAYLNKEGDPKASFDVKATEIKFVQTKGRQQEDVEF